MAGAFHFRRLDCNGGAPKELATLTGPLQPPTLARRVKMVSG